MKALRTLGLIGLGMLLAALLFYSVSAVRAQGPGTMPMQGMMGQHQAHHSGSDNGGSMAAMHSRMHGDESMAEMHNSESMAAMHATMHNNESMAEMHATMHSGEAMPAACATMMDDPEMQSRMMDMMHGETSITLDEMKGWMEEAGVPADVQAECLAHMAETHPELLEGE